MDPMVDVIIAGAGPVGLFLACELRLGGCSVLVLERDTGTPSPLKQVPFGIRGLSATSLDALHRRGMLDAVEAGMPEDLRRVAHWIRNGRRPAGHFAGIQFYDEDVDTTRWSYRVPGPAGLGLPTTLEHLEGVLARRAVELGAVIRRGLEVEEVRQSDHDVVVVAGGTTVGARWLVGCDGARSKVRKAAGFAFAGTEPELTAYSVDAELTDPDALQPGQHLTPRGIYTYAKPGVITMGEFDGGTRHRAEPVTRERIEAVLRRVSGVEIGVASLRLATTWTDRAFQAETYRRGRFLLAGDAAHIHSPLGGQGLNLGLGDAMNLGWKLAATARGDAPPDLLDSYTRERHPVGAQILEWSRAQVALMRPDAGSRALAAILRDVIGTRDGATYFAERKAGVSLRYDLDDGHPLIGRSAPDFVFKDGRRLGELLRAGRSILLDFEAGQPLISLDGAWGDRLHSFALQPEERLGLAALLVRPDGVVAWATDTVPDLDKAAAAARRWLGTEDGHRA